MLRFVSVPATCPAWYRISSFLSLSDHSLCVVVVSSPVLVRFSRRARRIKAIRPILALELVPHPLSLQHDRISGYFICTC